MNYCGSYRALLNNSKAAMLAAIEIYNKPQIQYRDECFVILLVNSWELLLKAILSKNRERVFYPKERKHPYRTLSLDDACNRAQKHFPVDIHSEPVIQNLKALARFRDQAIHFYNDKGFRVVIYGLAQTNIVNYADLFKAWFDRELSSEMTIMLLPLGLGTRPDPIQFLKQTPSALSRQAAEYIQTIREMTQDLETADRDLGRFITHFDVSLNSRKKITGADVVVGISNDDPEAKVVQKKYDPNITHPLRRRDIIEEIGPELHGHKFTANTLQAINWKYDIKTNSMYYWCSNFQGVSHYSRDYVQFIRGLTREELTAADQEYKKHLKDNRRRRKKYR